MVYICFARPCWLCRHIILFVQRIRRAVATHVFLVGWRCGELWRRALLSNCFLFRVYLLARNTLGAYKYTHTICGARCLQYVKMRAMYLWEENITRGAFYFFGAGSGRWQQALIANRADWPKHFG